jgi:hypothetical protein
MLQQWFTQNYICAASLPEFISITFFLSVMDLYNMLLSDIVAFNPFMEMGYKQVFACFIC